MIPRAFDWVMTVLRGLWGKLGRSNPPSPVDWLFDQAIELAVKASSVSAHKYEGAQNDIVRDALFALSQDAVITHRAVGRLTGAGWTGSSAVLLRTLMDLQISAAAILNSQNPKRAAFRYFYASYRRLGRDQQSLSREFRASAREVIRERIRQLPESQRKAALTFLKEKDRPYWFGEEWSSPSKVLEQFVPDLVDPYLRLSAAVHGSFLGSRLFREDPDGRSVNPEPPGLKAMEARLTSSRFLVDLTRMRSRAEGLSLEQEADVLRNLLSKAVATVQQKRPESGTA